MFDTDPSEIALRCQDRIDVFLRLEDHSQKRARFRCIAMITGDGDTADVTDFEPHLHRDAQALMHRAQKQVQDPVLGQTLSLNDMTHWPAAIDASNPLDVFLYLEFLRTWQVADMAAHHMQNRLAQDPEHFTRDPSQVAASVAPVFDFNRLDRGVAIARILQPAMQARIAAPGFQDDKPGSAGYALRMIGDLCLRAGENLLALACFETALLAGENPYRRRKAVEASIAAKDPDRLSHHLRAYQARWPLPSDLSDLAEKRAS
ncbi:hypothetical protein [Pararhodobacter sp.]|uniref:hypothetical protein n=1 Tax=Pararhodobacter sp. TaxID=2127056 RepID=UPI002AFF0311|nr:hypothetical protein [Pararhodobacter sp.]